MVDFTFTQERKDRWIAALRSGSYKQVKGSLKAGDGFCCIGVYADLIKDEIGGKFMDQDSFYIGDEETENYCDFLKINERKISVLWNLNDVKNYSFNEVADYIENNIKEVD